MYGIHSIRFQQTSFQYTQTNDTTGIDIKVYVIEVLHDVSHVTLCTFLKGPLQFIKIRLQAFQNLHGTIFFMSDHGQ